MYASLPMLIPAMGRLTRALGINEFLSLLFLILLVPLVYDKNSLKKCRGLTSLGLLPLSSVWDVL